MTQCMYGTAEVKKYTFQFEPAWPTSVSGRGVELRIESSWVWLPLWVKIANHHQIHWLHSIVGIAQESSTSLIVLEGMVVYNLLQ